MAQFIKANNQTALNTNGSYTIAGVPGANDDILFNNTFTGFTSVPLGGSFSVNKLILTNPTNNVSINTTSANLGVGAGGVDMSTATKDLTITLPANIAINSTTGGVTIASGRSLTATGIISFGNGLRQYGAGGVLNIYSPVGSQVIGDVYTEGIFRIGFSTDSRIYTTTDRIFTGNIILSGSGAVLTYEATGNQTLSGNISGEGYIQKYNNSTLSLTGVNTFAGLLNLLVGSIRLGNSLAAQNASVVVGSGTTLVFEGSQNYTFKAIAGAGNLALTNSVGQAVQLTINNPGLNIYSGVLSGAGSIVKNNTGTVRLTNINTYTGGTTINSGTLELIGGSDGNAIIGGVVTLASGTLLNVGESSGHGLGWSTNKVTTLNSNKGKIDFLAMGHLWNCTANLTGTILQVNGGVTTDSSTRIEYAGVTLNVAASDIPTTIGGHLGLRQDHDAHTFNVNRGSSSRDLVISASMISRPANTCAITKNNGGIMTLLAKNIYSGATTVNSGTLEVSGSGYINSEAASAVQANLIKNDGFEINTLVSEWTYNGGAEITGWSVVNILTKVNGVTWTVPANDTSVYCAGIQSTGVIRQTVNFTKTGTYILKWKANGRGGVQLNPYYVTLNESDVGALKSWDTTNGTWKVYQQEIDIPSVGSYTVGFRGTATTDLAVFFDDISLAYAEHAQVLAINNSSIFIYASSTDQVISGNITGNGTIKKLNNTSTLILAKTNNASITVEAVEGTINIVPSVKITTNTLKLNGGNLQLGNN